MVSTQGLEAVADRLKLNPTHQGILIRLVLCLDWDTDTYACSLTSLGGELRIHRKNLVAKLEYLEMRKAIAYSFETGHPGWVQVLILDELLEG